MKFSAVVLTVAVAASQTNAFMAPNRISRTFRPVFSSETSEETTGAATTTEDTPEADLKNFEEKVAKETAAELNTAVVAAAASAPVPITAATYELKTVDKSKIIPGRYAEEKNSIALPMLGRPPKLDGTQAGDFGFDPLGFTEDYDLFTMQEAELRHARLAMLAVIGWPMSELLAPSWMLQNGCAPSVLNGVNPLSAIAILAAFGGLGFFEYKTALRRNDDTKFGLMHRNDLVDCVDGKYGVPGDYGFDPLNLYSSIGDNAYARKGLREVEVSHGRMAMLGITGFALSEYVTGHPIVENSMFFHPNAQLPALVAAYFTFGYFFERDDKYEGTYFRYKMSSEGKARWENLQMGIGNSNGGANAVAAGSGSAGGLDLDAFSDIPKKISGFAETAKKTYANLEKSYMDNVVNRD